ncbi:MAG: hypothetical protein ACYCXW_05300 [Solirubrobacteraceae bacterium]
MPVRQLPSPLPALAAGLAAVLVTGVSLLLLAPGSATSGGCEQAVLPGVAELPAAGGERVGATEYGGPGDPSSGTVGAMGVSLLAHPDSYAELGGYTFQTADALGGLPYMTPLRITWDDHSAVAYKRDFGFGGGPIDGLPRKIDLWWQFAGALGIPYEGGMWSGPVRIEPASPGGAGSLLGLTPAAATRPAAGSAAASCSPSFSLAALPVVNSPRAVLLPDGQAAAPAGAPPAVQGIIAAGNQIAGKPYLYGGGHGLALDQIAPAYDCSSSVEHLLYGGGLLPVNYDAASGTLESFGLPGPGRWVTIYASADHVFMYVAGLRWDTWNAAGPGDGSTGIGWHPLVRESAGFVVRHPRGL